MPFVVSSPPRLSPGSSWFTLMGYTINSDGSYTLYLRFNEDAVTLGAPPIFVCVHTSFRHRHG